MTEAKMEKPTIDEYKLPTWVRNRLKEPRVSIKKNDQVFHVYHMSSWTVLDVGYSTAEPVCHLGSDFDFARCKWNKEVFCLQTDVIKYPDELSDKEKVEIYESYLHQINYAVTAGNSKRVKQLVDRAFLWGYSFREGNGDYSDEEQSILTIKRTLGLDKL